jgi:hypothetical protein
MSTAISECGRSYERSRRIDQVARKEWYEEVSPEELAAIKAAMVSGIATHSGHWYNCENGHPVSLIRKEILHILYPTFQHTSQGSSEQTAVR